MAFFVVKQSQQNSCKVSQIKKNKKFSIKFSCFAVFRGSYFSFDSSLVQWPTKRKWFYAWFDQNENNNKQKVEFKNEHDKCGHGVRIKKTPTQNDSYPTDLLTHCTLIDTQYNHTHSCWRIRLKR